MQIGIPPPERKSVEQLFAGDIRFSVPRYQHSYAWGTDEIEEVWEDLIGAIQRGGEYFLGTLVFHRKEAEQQEIIDSRQRVACITTFSRATTLRRWKTAYGRTTFILRTASFSRPTGTSLPA